MPDERFEDHLRHPRGRGHRPSGAAHATAGGAPCGDLVRLDVVVADGRVADAGFDAEGCGARLRGGQRRRGAPARPAGPRRRARRQRRRRRRARRPEPGQASTRPIWRRTRCAGRSGPRSRAARPRSSRSPAARSWPSAGASTAPSRRCSAREDGGEVVGRDARAVARPGDRRRALAAARPTPCARPAALAHRMGLAAPHPRPARRVPGGRRRPVAGRPRRRADARTRACAATAASASTRCSTSPTAWARRPWPPATTRASTPASGLLRLAADPAKDQTYMLAAPQPARARAAALPARRADEARGPRARRRAGLPVAAKPGLAGPVLPGRHRARARSSRRHGDLGERAGRRRRPGRAAVGRHRGAHLFTVGQRRGLRRSAGTGEPLYVLRTDVGANTVTVGAAGRAAHRHRARAGRPLHRPRPRSTP